MGYWSLIRERDDVAQRFLSKLRTVPCFATAHRMCASQDGPRSFNFLGRMSTNSKVFWGGLWRCGKKDLNKAY